MTAGFGPAVDWKRTPVFRGIATSEGGARGGPPFRSFFMFIVTFTQPIRQI